MFFLDSSLYRTNQDLARVRGINTLSAPSSRNFDICGSTSSAVEDVPCTDPGSGTRVQVTTSFPFLRQSPLSKPNGVVMFNREVLVPKEVGAK